jgi:hypothetical protein
VTKAIRDPSQELINKLVNAGYLQATLRNDPNAITTAIVRLKEVLRGGQEDEGFKTV